MPKHALCTVQVNGKFCTIMKATHDGELLRQMVEDAGIKIQPFARLMGYKSRNTPTSWFGTPQLEDRLLLKAAKVLGRNAGDYFPRLGNTAQPLPNTARSETQEPNGGPSKNAQLTHSECMAQLAANQQKLIETLEQYNKLLIQHNQTLERLARPLTGASGGAVAQPLHDMHVI